MSRARWWILLLLFSAGVVGLDVISGPYVLFPISFVVPVALGAWFLGRGPGV